MQQILKKNLEKDENYYSMDVPANVRRAREDPDYLGEVLLANENLIWASVYRYIGSPGSLFKRYNIEKDDILQLGRIGFIKAVKAFDTERGLRFSSFAVTAIVREIRCFLRDSANIIRPTRTASELMNRIKRIECELGYLPSTEELSVLLDEDEEKIIKAIQILGKEIKYLEEINPASKQETNLLDNLVSNEDIEMSVVDKVYVESILKLVKEKFSDVEVNVVKARMAGLNKAETARAEDVSHTKVNRILKRVAKLIEEEGE